DIVRGFAQGLAPVALEAEGLSEALSQLAVFVEKAFGVRCWTTCMALPDCLDSTATTHLYRIAQELATNAARHAKPEGIGISISVSATSLNLQVTNDGTPFDGKPVFSSGMGLHAVRKHVDSMGGRIEFKPSSKLLGGTTVIARFPLPREDSFDQG
ncbi:MAG: ATP-binding protein, partial [Verrucomicrobiales bacterium]